MRLKTDKLYHNPGGLTLKIGIVKCSRMDASVMQKTVTFKLKQAWIATAKRFAASQ